MREHGRAHEDMSNAAGKIPGLDRRRVPVGHFRPLFSVTGTRSFESARGIDETLDFEAWHAPGNDPEHFGDATGKMIPRNQSEVSVALT